MNDIDWLNILKWVLIVLLAGFIGQFGKSFAKHLMEKARLKREKAIESNPEVVIPRDTLKEADSIYDQGQALSLKEAEDRAKQEKKMAKAISKQKKKEAKNLEKAEK
ncbi:MAG: hypothetical protein JW743_06985 [Deltaproteobacteria bacterium]|nr:hypothetical protein [Deltaproteobacteria bacterium]MBN2846085.1 hypothetical protein [Deltaproteobacteria bacterium]